jgi:hypothetical protein
MPPRHALATRTSHPAHPVPAQPPPGSLPAPVALPPWLALFEDSRGAAIVTAALLEASPGPATGLLEWLCGQRLHAEVTRINRMLTPEECAQLDAPGSTWGAVRTGQLVTASGIPAADVVLLLLPPPWIPERAWQLLATTSTPAGTILEAFGLRRIRQRAAALHLSPGQPAVKSCAALLVGGQLAGLVREEVTPEFCELAARHARPEYG